MIAPAHTQQATTRRDGHDDDELAAGLAVGVAPVADRHAGGGHAQGDDQHEPAGEAHPGLLGPGVLAALHVLDAVVDEVAQPAVEVGAADLVGDQQRLAGGVGGRVGEAVLEHARRCGGSRWRCSHSRWAASNAGRSSSGPRRPDLEQGLGHRPPERAGEDADLLDHPRPRLLGDGAPLASPVAVAGDREAGRRTGRATRAGAARAEDGVAERPRPAGPSTPTTAANSAGRTSSRPAWASQSWALRRGRRAVRRSTRVRGRSRPTRSATARVEQVHPVGRRPARAAAPLTVTCPTGCGAARRRGGARTS